MNRPPKNALRRGFTLIELLVVVAIIGIIASILFPVFDRARENARRAACMSNLKQLGLGLMQYTQDWDERYPASTTSNTVADVGDFMSSGALTTAHRAIYPYVKSIGVYNCPSAVITTGAQAPTAISSTSYLLNGNTLSYPLQATGFLPTQIMPGLLIAKVPDASGIIYFQEFSQRDNRAVNRPGGSANSTYTQYFGWCFYDTVTGTYAYSNQHFDGGNMLFGDGHVKWRARKSIQAKDYGLAVDAPGTPVASTATPSPSNCYSSAGLVLYRSLF